MTSTTRSFTPAIRSDRRPFSARCWAVQPRFGPFWDVELDNHVTLAYIRADQHLTIEHYAFLVSEDEFDQIFERIQARGLPYWADPAHQRPGSINHHDGGRGVYWNDPDGHYLEIITRPYGGDG